MDSRFNASLFLSVRQATRELRLPGNARTCRHGRHRTAIRNARTTARRVAVFRKTATSLSVERRARQSQQTPGTAHALKTRRPRRLADKLCLLRGASREKDRRSMKRRNVHGGKSPATQPRAGPGRVLVRVATSQQQQQYFAERFHRAHCFRSHPAWWPCRSASGGGAPPHRAAVPRGGLGHVPAHVLVPLASQQSTPPRSSSRQRVVLVG